MSAIFLLNRYLLFDALDIGMDAGASGNKGLERNKPLEVWEEELDMDEVSKIEVVVDCMCCVWIG